ncbi:MAG: toxic anion resistance protein [Erysipelotrichaceae bacterium]|nr:toxic anion resistance protein [Erysipelotrichaceae bacterium]
MSEDKITLTLDAEEEQKEEEQQVVTEPEKQVVPIYVNDSALTEEEKKQVEEFAKTIDLTQSNVILQYGASAQKKIASFSENTLANVKTKDLGAAGNMLSDLIVELKGFDATETEEKGLAGFFKKGSNKVRSMKARYEDVEKNVNQISAALESHQIQLMKDIALLDELYDKNLLNFKELTMYILAGKKRLEEVRNNDLPKLVEKARLSGLAEDSQAANDLAQMCDRFEKKLYDLELTRNISLQMGPQIRLVQNNDTLMTEKIQSTLVNTIPLWKSQMVLALGINHSKQAVEAQQEVSKMTNELLKKNAQTLKMATVETAKESERGIVDIETLKQTNMALIQTLDEVVKIQDEGRAKRKAAEDELAKIEGELKDKLLDIHA